MPGTTSRFALRYQTHDDPPAGHLEGENLANDVEARLGYAGAQGGKSIIPAEQSRTNTSYGLLGTPDRVSGLVLPNDDDLIFIAYEALWKCAVGANGRAAIFINSNQLKVQTVIGSSRAEPIVNEARPGGGADIYQTLVSAPFGLANLLAPINTSSHVATGQALAIIDDSVSALLETMVEGNTVDLGPGASGGICVVKGLPAGEYEVSVQYRATSGSVTAKERALYAWTKEYPGSGV
jgi:hypothetical protein